MNIINYFPNLTLTSDQQNAIQKLQHFLESDDDIFILKGYAGTGKTTLLKGLTNFLNTRKQQYQIMAPTGRAAKILREKTGVGSTIHSAIYNLEDVDFSYSKKKKQQKDNRSKESYKLIFPIREDNLKEGNVLIIDEASMISNMGNKQHLFKFGTDILLQDILTYANFSNLKTKIIFVGDPAQLPPVGDNKSWAFEPKLFENKGLSVCEVELKQVTRQSNNNILENSILIRSQIEEEHPNKLVLNYDQTSFIKLKIEDIVSQYTNDNPIPELENGVIISFSNMQCYHYNKAVRDVYFPNKKDIQTDDIIQIISNQQLKKTKIYNGDFAKILDVSDSVETISVSVSLENGKTEKVFLRFRNVIMKLDHFHEPIECFIVDSLLNSTNRDLTLEEHKALYINFIMRFDAEQKRRKKDGLPIYKRHSQEFKDMLLTDKYMNAVRCKYGYAITCHKAQGGEWNNVIVDYTGRVGLSKDALRWAYTATTRAIKTCYTVNPPHFNLFTKFEVRDVLGFSKIPKEAYSFEGVPLSPFHTENQHPCKSKLYWDVLENLEDTDFKITDVLSRDYLERYTLSDGETAYVIEGHHNGAGIFTKGFTFVTPIEDEVLKAKMYHIFDNSRSISIHYTPTTDLFNELYSVIQNACNELGISITNVVERPHQYFVNYFFKSDTVCSFIQFYFNSKGQLTKAQPRTYEHKEDNKLQQLITKIKEHVI